jgi:hypothetical protein
MAFQKATRRFVYLKIAITGPSGSGKTKSALEIAAGLCPGGKIGVIDSENRSACAYADQYNFEVDEIEPPFTVQRYNQKIHEAVKEKFDVLIIDSISHQWAGPGGLLEVKDAMDAAGSDKARFSNWNKVGKQHESFKSALLQTDIHIICTIRSKQGYMITEASQGQKGEIRKVGMDPIQRDGIEYEFVTVFDMNMKHFAEVSKDRTGLFDGTVFQPSKLTGEMFRKWLDGAAPALAKPPPAQPKAKPQSAPQQKAQVPAAASPKVEPAPITPEAKKEGFVNEPSLAEGEEPCLPFDSAMDPDEFYQIEAHKFAGGPQAGMTIKDIFKKDIKHKFMYLDYCRKQDKLNEDQEKYIKYASALGAGHSQAEVNG